MAFLVLREHRWWVEIEARGRRCNRGGRRGRQGLARGRRRRRDWPRFVLWCHILVFIVRRLFRGRDEFRLERRERERHRERLRRRLEVDLGRRGRTDVLELGHDRVEERREVRQSVPRRQLLLVLDGQRRRGGVREEEVRTEPTGRDGHDAVLAFERRSVAHLVRLGRDEAARARAEVVRPRRVCATEAVIPPRLLLHRGRWGSGRLDIARLMVLERRRGHGRAAITRLVYGLPVQVERRRLRRGRGVI